MSKQDKILEAIGNMAVNAKHFDEKELSDSVIGVRVSKDLKKDISSLAKRKSVSRSEIVRQTLKAVFKK